MIKDKTLSHFYIIEGDSSHKEELIEHLASKRGININSNPDFLLNSYETFGIDDSRNIKNFFETSSLSNNFKIAVIQCDGLTVESQNALLKISEEPASNQYLFIIVSNIALVLETLLSRAQIIKSDKKYDNNYNADDFLEMNVAERISYVNKIITKKDKNKAKDLLDRLIISLRKKKDNKKLKEVYESRSYLNDRACSIKLILEHISLILS